MPETRPAVLFDVDGTLVDTNWFHSISWWRTFRKADLEIPMSRIHPLIGMGGTELLEELVGEARKDLKDGHGKEFEAFVDEIHAFPKAGELVRAVHERGALVAYCTSSKEDHLNPMLEAIGAGDVVDEIINADDVDHSKPSPDVFSVGLEKLKMSAEHCIVLGDTRWDVEAAAKVGLKTVCVLTGGHERDQLLEAGAVAVYEDAADLLAHLDESPIGALLGKQ